jgi:hypothetical protein
MRVFYFLSAAVAGVGCVAQASQLAMCESRSCGEDGPRAYAYAVDATADPIMEFAVSTNDIDPGDYTNVLTPAGWNFAVEAVGEDHACGGYVPDGGFSLGGCGTESLGRARWWTDDPDHAIETFTFGFDQDWPPEDAGWEVQTVEGPASSAAWGSPVGLGAGPVHGPGGSPPNFRLGAEEFVALDSGEEIVVPGYSVPSFVRWDGDDLPDLVVGEGGDTPGKVRVYLNTGTAGQPAFETFFYAQSNGADLSVAASGCLGAFPRVVYWDGDDRKDLLVGMASGKVRIYLNVGTDENPTFDGGAYLQVGEPGAKVDISVLARATPSVVDWNDDGRKDLVVGSYDSTVYIFINEGTDSAPDFRTHIQAQLNGSLLVVPGSRSSPEVIDLDGDGKKDLLAGNVSGQLFYYSNSGTDADPSFSTFIMVRSAGLVIDLEGTPRSRPSVCDWNADGLSDVLLGSGDGKVRLYRNHYATGDLNCDGAVNAFDIDPFVLALTSAPGFEAYQAVFSSCEGMLADANGDGAVNAFDIDPFVRLLTGG